MQHNVKIDTSSFVISPQTLEEWAKTALKLYATKRAIDVAAVVLASRLAAR